ncbi:MAG: HIT family protein [Candidatus Woesearchaeota archaeon]
MDPQQEYEEKIKNMSPEELKEFQKKQCIFCQIISSKVQSRKLFSDDDCTAVLDINPANPGHILLLPNEHYAIMPLIPDKTTGKLSRVAKGLSNAILKGLKAGGTTVFIANGLVAGQKAQHFMMHVIPRMADDGIEFKLPAKQMTANDMHEVQKRIKKRLYEILGVKDMVTEELPAKRETSHVEEKKPAEKPAKTDAGQTDLDSISRLFK